MLMKSLILTTLLLIPPVAAGAQSYAIEGADRYFRIEAETTQGRRGPVVSGYIYNTYGHTAGNVRLEITGLDASGQVTSTTLTQVFGTVPPGGRAYFEARAPQGATNARVRVLSYEPVGRGQ